MILAVRLIEYTWLVVIGFILLPFVIIMFLLERLYQPEFAAGMAVGTLVWLWLDLMIL